MMIAAQMANHLLIAAQTFLPPSVGENVLAGNSYRYSQTDDKKTKTITYVFKDDTVTETEVKQPTGESPKTQIWEYK